MPFSMPDAALGAIGASVVAATVSLIGLTVTKEQKVSELRQAWIDALRADLSELLSHAQAIHGAVSAQYQTRQDLWSNVSEHFVGISRAAASIELRLNPNEEPAKAILACLREYEALFNSSSPIDFKSISGIERRLISAAQPFLRAEWKRVKRGEPIYRIAKHASWLTLVILLFVLLYTQWSSSPTHATRESVSQAK